MAEHFSRHHPSDPIRLASFEARGLLLDGEPTDAMWRDAESCGSLLVAGEAAVRRATLEDASG